MQNLPQKQKEAIANAKKLLSVLNLDEQRLNASKVLRQIQNQQKIIDDSLRAAGKALINQKPAKLALRSAITQWKSNTRKADNSSFNYYAEPGQKIAERKITGENEQRILEINGEEFRVNSTTNTFCGVGNLHQGDAKTKSYYRVIADI